MTKSWQKSVLGERNSRCKGPEAGKRLINGRKASVVWSGVDRAIRPLDVLLSSVTCRAEGV